MTEKKEIEIRLFASVREKIGKDSIFLPCEEKLTVEEIKERIGKEYPQVAPTVERSRLALDMKFLSQSDEIQPGEEREIALIPPVSGG